MKPTSEQLSDPKWWDERAGSASHYCPVNGQFYDARLHPCCIPRPAQWRGMQDGLPPEDTECEIYFKSNETPVCKKAVITYQGDGVGCYRNTLNGKEYTISHHEHGFRPVQSERDRIANKAVECTSDGYATFTRKNIAFQLFDAGMLVDPERKPMSRAEAIATIKQVTGWVADGSASRLADALGYKE